MFTLGLNSWCQTSIRNSKSYLNCNWIEWIHLSYLPLLQKLQYFPSIIFPKCNNHKTVCDVAAFHPCLPKNWKMPSNSDIPNSIPLIIINLTFLPKAGWQSNDPPIEVSFCMQTWATISAPPTLFKRVLILKSSIYVLTIMIIYHVPDISEMRYLCSELKLIIHFPTEILTLTLLFLDKSKQGALLRIQDSWVPGL